MHWSMWKRTREWLPTRCMQRRIRNEREVVARLEVLEYLKGQRMAAQWEKIKGWGKEHKDVVFGLFELWLGFEARSPGKGQCT